MATIYPIPSLLLWVLDAYEIDLQGEEHRLFWPTQTEFVRLAAQFNATIVPFGVVGEDDLLEVSKHCDFIRKKKKKIVGTRRYNYRAAQTCML